MRLLFAGTPSIALPALGMLNEQQEVVGVLTAPDKPGKRGKDSVPSPIKTLAEELSLPVLQFERLGSEAREEVTPLAPELLVVAAYGKIFGPKFLSLFSSGGINLHPSLLPRHRGPSPIQETILSGDETAGVTIQTISLEVDAGDILLQKSFPLTGREQAPQLEEKAAETGAELLAETVRRIEEGTIRPRPQDPSGADYCRKITKHDGLIDWHEDARTID
ncbi:MAG: methionyl-tRNA formyltransferase, partial [Spirochaetales bacterium]|nr:methionyl-tRNA formyltransferase [Spirochaetales bacterium]MCF7937583.1 methionyl-tRNA formyltransferase [Spirochaetales bacterium]